MRLQKYLSQAGVASRRAGEAMIRAGRVRVNGVVVTEMGMQVEPGRDVVEVDDRTVSPAEPVWVALHKPPGYVTTRKDPRGRRTIYDLLPERYAGLFHVGRLDYGSEGLLLLTNEGDVAHRLLHPRHRVPRVYEAIVDGAVDEATLERLTAGLALGDGVARAESARRLRAPRRGGDVSRLRVVMLEGRKREVRRLCAAVGHPVRRLVRRRYGPIGLGSLKRGEWRELTARETAALHRI